jgi:hypothetical protein
VHLSPLRERERERETQEDTPVRLSPLSMRLSGEEYKSIAELVYPWGLNANISLCTTRPLKTLTSLIGLTQSVFSGSQNPLIY